MSEQRAFDFMAAAKRPAGVRHLYDASVCRDMMTACAIGETNALAASASLLYEVTCPRCQKSAVFAKLSKVRAKTRSTCEARLENGTLIADLNLPEMLMTLSLWGRWVDLILAGHKLIETREWPFPYLPGWIGLHASVTHDRPLSGVELAPSIPALPRGARGALVGAARVLRCRPLVREDLSRALLYGSGRYAWELGQVVRLRAPVPMRGPQKWVGVPRVLIEQALAGDSV
jgi:hypothetical protein